jgi:uncharacterized protein (TIGR03437 family)
LPQILAAATVVHRPYLQNLSANRVTIVWSTRENVSAYVQYSTDASYSQTAAAAAHPLDVSQTDMGFTFYQYRAELTGLTPGTAYNYQVIAGGQNLTPEPDHRFSTPAAGPFTFLAFGDSGDGSSHQLSVALQLVKEQPNLVLHLGDIAYQSGTFNEFTANYFEYYYTMMRRACFFPIAGNHEYYTQNAFPFLALSAPPDNGVPEDRGRYYSFDWGNAHFVGLDANLLDVPFAAAQARMLAWLESDLASTQAQWKIVFWHQTPYPISQHVTDPIDISARALFVPILERHGVQLVLTGHEHIYTRSKPLRGGVPVAPGTFGTVYFTSGGGGGVSHAIPAVMPDFLDQQSAANHYLRVSVDGARLTVQAIGTDGKEFDRLVMTQPSFAAGSVVNGADFLPGLATGGLVTIFGQGLATGIGQATAFPLPFSLSGTSVALNGTPMAMTYASPTQINAVLPPDALGAATLRVTTASGSGDTPVNITDTAPAIFPSAITHANGALVSASAPVIPGETLEIYMTGLGRVDGTLATGQPAPASPLLHVLAPVVVQIGDTMQLPPDFAGLTPGLAGVYQVNVVVPQNLPARTYPLRVTVQGNPSNSQNIQVQARNP